MEQYKSYASWDPNELWQWFAYHYGWFWFRRRQFDTTCPVDPKGKLFNASLVKLAYEAYCSEYCARCRANLRRGDKPCENHRPPQHSDIHVTRTPEEIAEVERKTRIAIFNIQRWGERNREAFNPIAAVHELLGVTASERQQLRDEQAGTPVPEQSALQRRQQLDRYIRGELAFKGQRHDSREVLESALANVHRATARTPPPELSTSEEIPAWVTESSDG